MQTTFTKKNMDSTPNLIKDCPNLHGQNSVTTWLEQQLDSSGIDNSLLREQFQPCNEGFTVQGVDLDGNPNRDSWQIRLRTPGEDGAKYKTKGKQGNDHGVYDTFLPAGTLGDFSPIEDKHEDFFDKLTRKESREALSLTLGQFLIKYPSFPIIITEGAKKACSGLQNGHITLSIPGCSMWHQPKSPELIPMLNALCVKGRPVYVALDADFRDKDQVRAEISQLSKALTSKGCNVRIAVWDINQGKGMDDFIVNGGNFDEVIKTALTIAAWEKQFCNNRTQVTKRSRSGGGDDKLSPIQKAQKAVESMSLPLRFNELSKEIESSPGEGVDGDALWVTACADPDLYTSVDTFYRVLSNEAKKDSYHPIQEYLKGCHEKYGDDVSVLNDIARRYLGTSDPLHQIFLVKWLIGAVARAMTPGCKMDTALVLHGSQGIGKSTFFNILGGDWFTDSLDKLDSSNKDELLKAHQSWLIELAEIENAFSKTAISKIKQSMSATTDQIRPPYGRKTEKCKRGFVICGTTNQPQFLNDPTGSRRFWVISCNGRVNRESLAQERDQIWGAAYALWARGEKWYLTEFEEEALAINNEGYESQDPWVEFLRDALIEKGEPTTTVKDCFEHLDMPGPKSHNSREARRIKDCLTHLGYKPEKFYRDGKQVRGWAIESLDKLKQNFRSLLSQLSQDAGTQSTQAFDNKTVQQNLLSHTVSTVSTDDDGDAEQDRQDSGKTVQDSTLSHPQTHTGQGIQDNKTVETVKPQTFNQDGYSVGDNVWVESTQNTPQLTPPEQLNHGDRVAYVPYGLTSSKEMIYVGEYKDGRHWIVSPEHFKKGMKGSRQWCTSPYHRNETRRGDDIFWKV